MNLIQTRFMMACLMIFMIVTNIIQDMNKSVNIHIKKIWNKMEELKNFIFHFIPITTRWLMPMYCGYNLRMNTCAECVRICFLSHNHIYFMQLKRMIIFYKSIKFYTRFLIIWERKIIVWNYLHFFMLQISLCNS